MFGGVWVRKIQVDSYLFIHNLTNTNYATFSAKKHAEEEESGVYMS